jgi:hypothetical protein
MALPIRQKDPIVQANEKDFFEFNIRLNGLLSVKNSRRVADSFVRNSVSFCFQKESFELSRRLVKEFCNRKMQVKFAKVILDLGLLIYIGQDTLRSLGNVRVRLIYPLVRHIKFMRDANNIDNDFQLIIFIQLCLNLVKAYHPRTLSSFFYLIDKVSKEDIYSVYGEFVAFTSVHNFEMLERVCGMHTPVVEGLSSIGWMGDITFDISCRNRHVEKKFGELLVEHYDKWVFMPTLSDIVAAILHT